MPNETHNQEEADAGVQESRQTQDHQDVAKQRPGQEDQRVIDEHSKKPDRKDGSHEPA